jgi:hypothetical protein
VAAVTGYDQLQSLCEQYVRNQSDVRNIILINCGASMDLRNTVFANNLLSSTQTVYVIDHQRPIHLNNIFDWPQSDAFANNILSTGQIRVIVSGVNKPLEDMRTVNTSVWNNRRAFYRQAVLQQVNNNNTDADDDEEGDDFNMDDEDDDNAVDDFIVHDSSGGGNEDEDDDDMQDDDYSDNLSSTLLPVRIRLKNPEEISPSEYEDLMKIAHYYTVSYSGVPSSIVVYEGICGSKSRQILNNNKVYHNSALWAMVIGFTSQFMKNKLTRREYNDYATTYAIKILDTNKLSRAILQTPCGNITETTSEVRMVYAQRDYVFTLYRHWDLYNSMLNTPALCAHVNDWSTFVDRVHQFLAKLGVPLTHCKEQYDTMLSQFKEAFQIRSEQCAQLLMKSEPIHQKAFVRHYGTDFNASAFDMVHILNTVMNKPLSATQELKSIVDPVIWQANYHVAQEALNGNIDILREGATAAIHAQTRIMKQTKQILSTQSSIRTDDLTVTINLSKALLSGESPFYIKEQSTNNNNNSNHQQPYIFVLTPNGLSELAQLLMNILEKMGKYKKPLLLIAPSAPGKELIVGVERNQTRNCFTSAFNKAAKSVNVQVKQVGFGFGMIEVNKSERINLLSGMLHEFQCSIGNTRLD